MLKSHLEKEPSKAEMKDKVEAWKTINSVLVRANSEFMQVLNTKLLEKQAEHEQLKAKLEKGEGSEQDNAEYLFLGGYVQCLKDILHAKVTK